MKRYFKKTVTRLKSTYKLVILRSDTFEERVSVDLTGTNFIVLFSSVFVIVGILFLGLVFLTPLKEYIPGYSDVKLSREVREALLKADSLEAIQNAREFYLVNLKNVLVGNIKPENLDNDTNKVVSFKETFLDTKRPKEDNELRAMIESEEENVINPEIARVYADLAGYQFEAPLKGIVTEKFKPSIEHYAVDVACKKGEKIKTIIKGSVLLATFTKETGYVIVLQHDNNLISIYKHCSLLLKKVGESVEDGDFIAVAGDTGEYSTGPHLHFEMWHNGTPINPLEFMIFN
jgi:murein DD-endopeptidase MepM/ murein hydrolase activator NlpD